MGWNVWAPFVARFNCDDITLERCDLRTNCAGPIVTLPNGQTVVYRTPRTLVVRRSSSTTTRSARPGAHLRNVNIIGNSVYTSATDIKGMGVIALAVGGQGEQGGTLRLEGNTYNVTDSAGHSNGGRGVDLFSEKPGIDVRMRNEVTRNATGPAYRARFSGSSINAMRHLDIDGVSASDDQTTPTCTAGSSGSIRLVTTRKPTSARSRAACLFPLTSLDGHKRRGHMSSCRVAASE